MINGGFIMELNKIFLGDCLEILKQIPSNSIDAVITDPPYASGGRSISEKSLLPSALFDINELMYEITNRSI